MPVALIGVLLAGLLDISATFAELIEKPRYYLGAQGTFTKGVVVFRVDRGKITVLVVTSYGEDAAGKVKLPEPTGKEGALGSEQVIPVKLTCRLDEQVCGLTKETKPDVGDLISVEARVVRIEIKEDGRKREVIFLEATSVSREGAVPLEAQSFWTIADAIARSAGGIGGLLPYATILGPILLHEGVPVTP